MAQSQFIIINEQILSNTSVTGNGIYDLYISPTLSNSSALPSLRLIIDYAENGSVIDLIGGINVIVEAENNGIWFPIAYQFEPYRMAGNGNQRIIMLQPDMNTYNDGIDSIVYAADQTLARISRQQGRVGSGFRVRVVLSENGYGTSRAFQSVKMSMYGELYD